MITRPPIFLFIPDEEGSVNIYDHIFTKRGKIVENEDERHEGKI